MGKGLTYSEERYELSESYHQEKEVKEELELMEEDERHKGQDGVFLVVDLVSLERIRLSVPIEVERPSLKIVTRVRVTSLLTVQPMNLRNLYQQPKSSSRERVRYQKNHYADFELPFSPLRCPSDS